MKRPETIALSLVLLAGCGTRTTKEASPSFLNVRDDVEYAGSQQCAQCHEEIFLGYQTHGMAQGFHRLTEDSAVEQFPSPVLRHDASGFYYQARRQDGRFIQEEYRIDGAGRKTHQLIRSMDYVVGSGSAARTYLTEVHDRLYELPLTWYTQAEGGRGRWDFSPGYEVRNARFSRAIPPGCMSCHNGVSEPVEHVEGMFRAVAEGIGCERCHGPGQLHIDERLADPEAPDSVDNTIVNPAHLPLGRRLDVCQQCHTNETVSVLREGETAYSFRPSERLEDHRAIFGLVGGQAGRAGRIGVISHAERMMKSECFVMSGAMDCVTCHNPHEGFRDAGPEYFNTTCSRCHGADRLLSRVAESSRQDHMPGADCFSCHMPKVEAEDAPHASFTDHYIRVVEAEGEQPMVSTTPDLEPFFERDREGPEAEAYSGMAYVVYGRQNGERSAMERGVSLLAGALTDASDLGEAHYLLGFARHQLGHSSDAIPAIENSLRLDPDNPERLNTLAQAYEAVGRDAEAIERLYVRALEIQPLAASVRVNLGRFLETRGDVAEAIEQYERAITDDPWLAAAHYNLGTAFLRTGQVEKGENALLDAIRLEPDHADALTNLGALAASGGRTSQAISLFRRALEAAPRNANALGNLALALAEQGNAAEARRIAEQALAVDPDQATARQVLAAL